MAAKRAFEKLNLTKEERNISKKICQQYKFTLEYPSDLRIQNLKAFTFGMGVINMLLENRRFDELILIFALLSVKEFVNVAAAAHPNFIDLFWTNPQSDLIKRFAQHFFLKSYFHDEPSYSHLSQLPTGSHILREYR
jgi:hypothetical protein